jgi:hypothetical protein
MTVRMRVIVRVALAALVLAVLFFAGYAAVARRLLSGPKLRAAINVKAEEFFMDWDEATSVWPGRVTVRNLRIRGSDPNVQWIVTIPQGTLRYSVFTLLRHKFLVTELRPQSIQFRLRQKVKPEDATDPRLKYLPPIPGFSDPPLREGRSLPPPESNPFTVELLDVTTPAFDDIWVDGYRYRGPSTLHGRFRLKPGHRAQIGPASVEFRGGELQINETPAMTPLEGRLDATFEDWDVQELIENKVWKVVTAKVSLSGPTPSVDAIDGLLKLGKKVHVSGGPGKLAIAGEIDHGIAKGSVDLTAKDGRYRRPDLRLVGSADAHLQFSDWNLDGGAPEIGGSSLKLTDVFVAGEKGRSRGWWGKFEIPSGRLSNDLTAKVVIQCRDARPLFAFLDDTLPKWAQGMLKLEGLTAKADVVLSEPRTTVRNLEVKGGEYAIEGEYDRRGERSRGAFFVEGNLLNVAVEIVDGKPKLHLLTPRKWFDTQRGLSVASR